MGMSRSRGGGGGTGPAGSQILTGSGAPGSGLGANSDFYLNVTNGDYYKKVSGSWGSVLGNLTGPQGPADSPGAVLTTSVNAAPADGTLTAGQLDIWFDSTAGAATLKIKAKNASGTVVTGEVALT